MVTSLIRSSYHQNFARSAGESAYPGLWRGLVGAIVNLGKTGDNIRDVAGNRRSYTLAAGMAWTPEGGLDFTSAGVDFGVFPDITGNKLSVVVGIQPHFASSDGEAHWIFDGDFGNANQFRIFWTGAWRFRVHADATQNLDVSDTFSVEDRFQLACVYNGATKYVYHNATLLGTQSETGNIIGDGGTDKRFGSKGDSTEDFNGVIRYIYFYDRDLKLSQIKLFRERPLAPFQLKRLVFKAPALVGGRIMSSLVNAGGLAGKGGIAGQGGGLAG